MIAAFALFRNSYVLAGLIAALVIATAVGWQPLRRLLCAPVMLYLGALSYCIYLFHQLVGGVAIELLQTLLGRTPGFYQLAILVAGMLATVAASAIIYARVEKPSIAFSRRIRGRRSDLPAQEPSLATWPIPDMDGPNSADTSAMR
jgi:peptidoglycan/LPS O-acetylase OafA/YrhL